MGGCAGLAGGCAPHIPNHRAVGPQRLQRVLSCLLWLSKVKLTNSEGEDFCGGALVLDSFVLTTATCSLLCTNVSVKTREYVAIRLDKMAPETKPSYADRKGSPLLWNSRSSSPLERSLIRAQQWGLASGILGTARRQCAIWQPRNGALGLTPKRSTLTSVLAPGLCSELLHSAA